MGRPRINEDYTPARLPAGTLDRIEAVLRERERRADFIRAAIERELKRREGMGARKAPPRQNESARTILRRTGEMQPWEIQNFGEKILKMSGRPAGALMG